MSSWWLRNFLLIKMDILSPKRLVWTSTTTVVWNHHPSFHSFPETSLVFWTVLTSESPWAHLQVEWLSIFQRHTLPLAALNAIPARQSQGSPATHLTTSSINVWDVTTRGVHVKDLRVRILFIPRHGEWNDPMKCFFVPNLESLNLFQNMDTVILLNYDNFMWCTCTTAHVGDWCGMVLLNQFWNTTHLEYLGIHPQTRPEPNVFPGCGHHLKLREWGIRIQPTKRRTPTPNSMTTCQNIHLHIVDTHENKHWHGQ